MKNHFFFRFVLLMGMCFCCMANMFAQAQKIYIESFTHDPSDRAAKEYQKEDSNGNLYALVKVRTIDGSPVSSAFMFNFFSLSHLNDGLHDGEVWLYVQKTARKVRITREGFVPIQNADLGQTLEAGETYILELSYVEPQLRVQKQWLRFDISPADVGAVLQVRKAESSDDYEIWEDAAKNMECGLYEYRIAADNYDVSEGRVMLNQPDETFTEKVKLVPDFGYLRIDDAYGIAGAQIYIDNKRIGEVPYFTDTKWKSGEYTLQITNGELYKTYNAKFIIEKGEITVLTPKLESNAAETHIRVNAEAEIYIDKMLMGKREWRGPLRAGTYEVECRMERHKPILKTIVVRADEPQDIFIDAPEPITGSLSVTSKPLDAEVFIDGKAVGTTPMTVKDLIIGQHTVSLNLANHKKEERTITILENRTENLSLVLSDMAEMTITSQPAGAELYLNGEFKGSTPYSEVLTSGDYDLKLVQNKYHTYEAKVHLDSSNPRHDIKLVRQYQQPTSVYLQPTYQAGAYSAIGGAVGGYFYNFNLEACYMVGMNSEMLYWNYVGTDDEGQRPIEEEFTSSSIGVKLGYGLCYGTRFRITPQVGVGVLSVTGSKQSTGYGLKAIVDARMEYALASCIGVSLTPEFGFNVNKSSVYTAMADVSSTIKGWGEGFNLKIGIYLFF